MTQRNWLGNTGAWSDPAQWAGGILPGTTDIAAFGPSGTFTVSFATTATVIGVSEGSSTGTLDVASGFLDLTGIGGNSSWSGLINQSGGTLALQTGTMLVNGVLDATGGSETIALGARLNLNNDATIDNRLAGAGTLGVGGAVTLGNNAIPVIAAIAMGSTGSLVLGANQVYAGAYVPAFGSLVLAGNQIIFSGHDNFGESRIVGPGTVAVDGSADLPATEMVGTGGTLFDAGTVTADGDFALGENTGDQASLIVDPTAVFDLLTDTPVASDNAGTVATGSIVNGGLFEKTAGVAGAFTNEEAPITNNGTLRVTLGTLLLSGPGSVLGGTIDGAGTLSISGTATLAAGALVNVATLSVGFAGVLALGGNAEPNGDVILTRSGTIALQGGSLTVQGQGQLDGTVDGPGSMFIGGLYDLNNFAVTGGSVQLEDQGVVTESGPMELGVGGGDNVGLQIDAHALYDIIAAPSSNASLDTGGSATIVNNGVFENTANGGGRMNIVPVFQNNSTGTILVATGTVEWSQSLINDGLATIDGTAFLAGGLQALAGNAGTLTVGSGGLVSITGAVNATSTIAFDGPGELIVNTASAFAGLVTNFAAGDTIDFAFKQANTFLQSANFITLQNAVNVTTLNPAVTVSTFQLNSAGFVLTGDGNGGTELLAQSPGQTAVNPFHTPVAMASWTASPTGTASWFTPGNWNPNAAPDGTDTFLTSSGGTVVFNGAATDATLDMTGGRLQVQNGGGWTGVIDQNAGVIDSVTGFVINSATYTEDAGAVLQSDSGTLSVEGPFTAEGTVQGASVVLITGTMTPVPGAVISVGTLEVNGTLVPYGGETITDDLVLLSSSAMPLFGSTLTLAGPAQLGGTVPDTATHPDVIIVAAGDTVDDSNLTMQGTGDLLVDKGTVDQTSGLLDLSAPGAALEIQSGAVYDIQGDVGIDVFSGSVDNAGLFEKTGGSALSELEQPFISTGTVMVNTGTLWLDSATVDLAGTIGGQGTLQTANGGNATVTLEPSTFINVATFDAGNVVLKGDQNYLGVFNGNGTIALLGHTLTLGGNTSELVGTIAGPGRIDLTRTADLTGLTVTGSGATISDAGTVTQSSSVFLGGTSTDSVTLAIGSGASYNILVDSFVAGISGTVVTGTIANAGLFEKTAGGGDTPISAELVNTGTVAVQHGTMTLNSASTNDGRMIVAGSMVVNAPLGADAGHTGTIEMTPTGTLVANAPIAASQTIVYDPGGLIAISQIGSFSAAIASFTPGDTIDLVNTLANRESYANGVLTMTETSGPLINPVGTLAIPGLANPAGITLANDGNSGTFIVEAPCFAAGTRIDTALGPVAVEHLHIGDLVMTARGAAQPVLWLGHRRVDCRRHPRPWDVLPVRVRAGAFGDGRPRHDLLLSPDHAVLCDGVLIPVRYLLNDATVVQEVAASVTYWHLELCRHDIVLAEGLPTESYLDTGNRHAFANGGRATALHPDFAQRAWQTLACAPLVTGGPVLARVRTELLGRATELGHGTTDAAEARLLVGGWVLRGRTMAEGIVRFDLPRHTSEVRLRSRSAVPAHVLAAASDHRRLGVAVARLWLDDREVPLTDACLGAGWHAPEAGMRWTDGDATITTGGARRLAVHTLPILRYWTEASGSGAAVGGAPYSGHVATG